MNVYKPLMIFNLAHSITIMTDGCTNFRKFLIEDSTPNLKKIKENVDRSLMLVTALSPVIGYDKASKIAHYAMDNDLTLKAAALKLGFVTEELFDRVVRSGEDGPSLRSWKVGRAATLQWLIIRSLRESYHNGGVCYGRCVWCSDRASSTAVCSIHD